MVNKKMIIKNKMLTAAVVLSVISVGSLTGCGQSSTVANGGKADMSIEEAVKNSEAEGDTEDSSDVSYGELSEGDTAPDFTAELVGGETFTLSENKGKVVLINIWATWCGPCVGEMPAFEKLNNEYGDDLKIVAVNCVEDKGTVDAFVKDNGYTFPIAYDENGEINNRYPTDGIPYTLVVGKDGVIRNIYLGADSEDVQYQLYKDAIDAALNE